jgi:hypothetical protein
VKGSWLPIGAAEAREQNAAIATTAIAGFKKWRFGELVRTDALFSHRKNTNGRSAIRQSGQGKSKTRRGEIKKPNLIKSWAFLI